MTRKFQERGKYLEAVELYADALCICDEHVNLHRVIIALRKAIQ